MSSAFSAGPDVAWHHAALCRLALPLRPPAPEGWSREVGGMVVQIEPGPGAGTEADLPLPAGRGLRLVLIHLFSTALAAGTAQVELGAGPEAIAERFGLEASEQRLRELREAADRLLSARLRLLEGPPPGLAMLDARSKARVEADGWRPSLRLNERFLGHLSKQAVPLDARAVGRLAGSVPALDAYVWLAATLPGVPEDAAALHGWDALRERFADGDPLPARFQEAFSASLEAAREVYPDAEFSIGKAGVELRRSPSPVPGLMPPAEARPRVRRARAEAAPDGPDQLAMPLATPPAVADGHPAGGQEAVPAGGAPDAPAADAPAAGSSAAGAPVADGPDARTGEADAVPPDDAPVLQAGPDPFVVATPGPDAASEVPVSGRPSRAARRNGRLDGAVAGHGPTEGDADEPRLPSSRVSRHAASSPPPSPQPLIEPSPGPSIEPEGVRPNTPPQPVPRREGRPETRPGTRTEARPETRPETRGEARGDGRFALPPSLTGLPMSVWLRRGERMELLTIEVTPGLDYDLRRRSVLAVEPIVLQVSGQLHPRELDRIAAWAVINADLIQDVWDGSVPGGVAALEQVRCLPPSRW